ncbi:hypothetical protein D3C84_689180 [compost metagenome]
MAQRRGLAGGFGLLEQRHFAGKAFFQRQQAGGFHRREQQARCQAALPAGLVLFAETGEEVIRQALGRLREGLSGARGGLAGDQLAGVGTGLAKQRLGACRKPVENAQRECAVGADLGAGQRHVECRLGADQPGQALGAAGAGEQSEVDFRQADAGAGFADAVAAGQRQLQAAAQGELADGRDQGLVESGQAQQQAGQVRRGKGGVAAELADIGAGTEQAVGAEEDDGAHRGVGSGPLAGVEYGRAQGLAEGVDRRTGEADQGQVVFNLIGDQGVHGGSL